MRFFGARRPDREARAIIVGLPYEGRVNCRPGAAAGPGAVRQASHLLETYLPALDRDLAEFPLADAGDLAVADPEAVAPGLARRVPPGVRPVVLGGDHAVSEGAVALVAERHPELAVVSLDAHLDFLDRYQGAEHCHATWARRVADRLGPGRLWFLGCRAFTREELHRVRRRQRALPLYEVDLETAARAAAEEIGSRPVYLSLDIDVLDPAWAPGVGNPEGLGVTVREFWRALEALAGLDVVGFDVVEVTPGLDDPSGRTALLAAEILRYAVLRWWS